MARGGDLSFDLALAYSTIDGTAIGGVDFQPAFESHWLAPQNTMPALPIIVLGESGNGPIIHFDVSLTGATGVGPAPSFSAPHFFTGPAGIYSVATPDINGDGKPDIVFVSPVTPFATVMLNTTPAGASVPSLGQPQTFGVGAYPTDLAVGDVNSDGKPDLVIANVDDRTLSILLNETPLGASIPSFSTQQVLSTVASAISVRLHDLNGDARVDLTVARADQTTSTRLNATLPGASLVSFGPALHKSGSQTPFDSSSSDLNGDGRPDIVVADVTPGKILIYRNMTAPDDLTPNFATPQLYSAPTPFSIAITDVNGDGKPDLISASGYKTLVLMNETPPGATAFQFSPTQEIVMAIPADRETSIADFNGDGRPDVLQATGAIRVLRNITVPGSTKAGFTETQLIPSPGSESAAAVASADMNGDGKLDLVTSNDKQGSIAILLNTTPATSALPSFSEPHGFAAGAGPNSVSAVDLNGDGKHDLVVIDGTGDEVSVMINTTGSGTLIPSFAGAQTFASGASTAGGDTADLNGDGFVDIVVADTADNTVSVLINTTAPGSLVPAFSTRIAFAAGNSPSAVDTADIDGDGRKDLVVAATGSDNVTILINGTIQGAQTPAFAPNQSFAACSSPVSIAEGDINGDGRPDLAVACLGSASVVVLVNTTLLGAAPTFAAPQSFGVGTNPITVTFVDVNGDGKSDLVAANQGDDSVSVLFNQTSPGSTTPDFGSQQVFPAGGAFSIATADIDANGKMDLIVANGPEGVVSILFNTTVPGTALAVFSPPQPVAAGSQSDSVIAADLNGDGGADLVAVNTAGDEVSVLLNSQFTVQLEGDTTATVTLIRDRIFSGNFDG